MVGFLHKGIQDLAWLGFLGRFLAVFLIRLLRGHRGGFPAGNIDPATFRTDPRLDLNRLKDHFLPFSHGLGLFMLYVLVLVGRDGKGGGLRGYVGGRFE